MGGEAPHLTLMLGVVCYYARVRQIKMIILQAMTCKSFSTTGISLLLVFVLTI